MHGSAPRQLGQPLHSHTGPVSTLAAQPPECAEDVNTDETRLLLSGGPDRAVGKRVLQGPPIQCNRTQGGWGKGRGCARDGARERVES